MIVLVDGSAVFHRGYHAIPHLTNKDGLATNGVYGFATILLRVLQELKPDYCVIAWDKSSATFRKEVYPEYKAHRIKQPDDLYAQVPLVHELVDALALPWVELDRFEADDIIGTFEKQAEAKGLETIIVTGDLDELQLVGPHSRVYTMRRGFSDTVIYDEASVKERYGVTPAQFIDVKALKGDASDNIPGVAGIGEKTAIDLVSKYKTLDGIYENLDQLKPAQQKKLIENRDMAYLSQYLSTIAVDAPVELQLEKSRVGDYDRAHIHELFRRLDFRTLLQKLPEQLDIPDQIPTLFDEPSDSTSSPEARHHLKSVKYITVDTIEELHKLASKLSKLEVFAFDTETTSIDTMVADLVGISISWEEQVAYYIPIGHESGLQLKKSQVIDSLKVTFEDSKIGKTGHNLKFDIEMLSRSGIEVRGVVFDTMIASFLINPLGRSMSLDDLAYNELGIEMIPIVEMIGKKGKDQLTFDKTDIKTATIYAAEDADISWRLYQRFKVKLKEEGFDVLAAKMEWPLIPILAKMELAGIECDVDFLGELGKGVNKRISAIKTEIFDYAGEEFNLASPPQLADILYNRLGLSTNGLKKGKTAFSTAANELEKLRDLHPIIPFIMEYRELEKLRSTYIDSLPELVKSDGRIHTSFNQTIVATGRLSSTNPNLQNIPVRTELGREIRQAFVAPEGRLLVSGDYSQIELRVAAYLAGDEEMMETFRKGIDLHQQTAAELYDIQLDQVTKEQRYAAKTINFGVLYGMSAHGLSVATGMDQKEAADFIKRYFSVRPKLAEYIESTKKFAYDNLYTETLFGRRRPCPEIRSNNFLLRSSAERVAVNVPIQGTAADIYKLAMIAVDKVLDPDSKLLLQIHDELIVETDIQHADKVESLLKSTMEAVYDIGVPLMVDVSKGKNWGEL